MFFYNSEKMPNLINPQIIPGAFDRTRVLFDCKEIVEYQSIGTIKSLSFNDICDERAIEIAKHHETTGRKVAIYWSGGIDSTLALVALRKVLPDKVITVVLNTNSIKEYPFFFDLLRYSEVSMRWVNQNETLFSMNDLIQENYIVVTGEIGDQIFGSVAYKSYPDKSTLIKPWKDVITCNEKSMRLFEALVEKCPQTIITTKEFFWWFSYVMKYQTVLFRMMLCTKSGALERDVFHFFNNQAFNDWAVSTPMEEKYYGLDERQYKMIAKQYIFNELKDSDYRDNKLKEVSLVAPVNNMALLVVSIDTEWRRTYKS